MIFAWRTIAGKKVLFAQAFNALLLRTDLVEKTVIVRDLLPFANGARSANDACGALIIPKKMAAQFSRRRSFLTCHQHSSNAREGEKGRHNIKEVGLKIAQNVPIIALMALCTVGI